MNQRDVVCWLVLSSMCLNAAIAQSPSRKDKPKSTELQIGIEYAMPGPAKKFAAMGVPVVKFYPDEIPWGKMQKSAAAPIDFSKLDRPLPATFLPLPDAGKRGQGARTTHNQRLQRGCASDRSGQEDGCQEDWISAHHRFRWL